MSNSRVQKNLSLTTLALLLAIAGSISYSSDAPTYRLQIGAYSNAESATARVQAVERAGYTPAYYEQGEDGKFRVFFGYLPTYMDAHVYRLALKENNIAPDSFVSSVQMPEGALQIEHTGDRPSIFNLPEGFFPADLSLAAEATPAATFTPEEAGKEYAQHQDNLRAALVGNEMPATSPRLGEAYRRLARYYMEDLNAYDEGFKYQIAVARGEVPSNLDTRLRSAYHSAWLLHNYYKDRVQAYMAYKELAAASLNPSDRCRFETEAVGLLMELALSEKGSMADMRREADRIIADIIPLVQALPQTGEARAASQEAQDCCLLELMRAESYAKEGDYSTAIVELETFIESHKNQRPYRRQVGAATLWKGVSHQRLEQIPEAIAAYEDVVEMNITFDEDFKDEYLDAKAASWLLANHQKSEDSEGVGLWLSYLRARYPNHGYTKAAEARADQVNAQLQQSQ
jgi:tetratricopeptide (TPR) repeat protein